MNFQTFAELSEFIINNKLSVSDLDISINSKGIKESTCGCHKSNLNEDNRVIKLISLSDAPIINYQLVESLQENEIYINSVEVIKDACGTGKLGLFDKIILVNVCESDNIIHVDLDLEINGKEYKKIPFVVKLTENSPFLKLNKII